MEEALPGSIAKEKPMSKEPTEEKCRHHWVIETAEDSVSKGVCRLCGAEKEFSNQLSDSYKKRTKKD